jgi:uncharacterized protein (TIGR02246 family)
MSSIEPGAASFARRRLLQRGAVAVASVGLGQAASASAVATAASHSPAPVPPSAASALAAVQARMQAQTAAWNRGDIAGFCAAYAEDCVFLSPSGLTRGRRTVEERYQKKYGAATATMGQLDFEPLSHSESPELVSLALRWRLRWPLVQPSKPDQSGLTLIVWQRQPGGWFLVQDASM